MVRRCGNLWEGLTSFENLYRAARKARRGKRSKQAVEAFEFDLEKNLVSLRRDLLERTYLPGPFRTFTITDPKPRLISAAPYRDRVVHHALCNVLEPIFERSFVFDSYACRRGKGTHAAVDRYTAFARKNRYVLKCDVRKFFPSVDHAMLLERLARKIKDPDVMWLASMIVMHSNPQEDVPGFFPGDDLFTTMERQRGIPIGNQTSQFFANVYLDSLDHFVKERLGCRYYIRYCDDFVILDNDRRRLGDVRLAVEQFLLGLRLWLHPKKRTISRVEDGLRFLGYRVWPDHRFLDRRGLARFGRRLRTYQRLYRAGLLSPAKPYATDSCVAGPCGSRRYLAVAEGFIVGYDVRGADGQMTVSFVAVPGTTGRTTPVPPNATGTTPTTGTTTQASVLPALRSGRMRPEHARAGRFTDRTGVQRCSPWPSLQCRWLMLSHRPNDKAARRVW